MSKYILKNGTIVDGTGMAKYQADLLIEGNIITKIGEVRDAVSLEEGVVIFDCSGLTISPGFIDCHSHSDAEILQEFSAFNLLEQGITTEIAGHCGVFPAPFKGSTMRNLEMMLPKHKENILKNGGNYEAFFKEIESIDVPLNFATYIGHGTIRESVMGFSDAIPTEEELQEMKELVREGMKAGALGLSTGLVYPTGCYSKEEEIIELCKVVGEFGGYYSTHMRSESSKVVESVEETIRIAEAAGIPAVISHHKIGGKSNAGKSIETLKLIDEANNRGLTIRLDQYPYDGGATALISSIPPKYATNGPEGLLEHLRNPETRAKIKEEVSKESTEYENLIYGSGFDGIIVVLPMTPQYNGMSVLDIANQLGKDPCETLFDLLLENEGGGLAIYIMISDWDLENIIKHPLTMGGVDGNIMNQRGELTHPRIVATFPKIIGKYCRDKGFMTLEECIRKQTGLPAEFYNLNNKGILKEGNDADMVVFDFKTIAGNANYANSTAANTGIVYVFVNGKLSVKNGTITGIKNGKIIRESIN